MRVMLTKRFGFEAAHFLPFVAEGHRCRRLHGHSFRVEISVSGEVSRDTGWFLDYGVMADAVKPWIDLLDHRLLNAVPGLENPTSELLAGWLWERLSAPLPGLARITVFETCTTRCDYDGPGSSSGARVGGAAAGPAEA
jgi:6-pyruvoyltetrahydropterin/6-carboxytetrahydropterin synthase